MSRNNAILTRDALNSAWYSTEFTASNAIIDDLCYHLRQLAEAGGVGSEYDQVFEAIHRRRMFWIPIVHNRDFHNIAEVRLKLREISDRFMIVHKKTIDGDGSDKTEVKSFSDEVVQESDLSEKMRENDDREISDDQSADDDSGGSKEVQHSSENLQICSNHKECVNRPFRIKITTNFPAYELVDGLMMNTVEGLQKFEDVFTQPELFILTEFVNKLRAAGRRGELSGETFVQFKGNIRKKKSEIIQLGVAVSGQQRGGNIMPMPALLQSVIDHLVQWNIIPKFEKPSGCLINFFDKDEHTVPFKKPPQLDQPIYTLVLPPSRIAFGYDLRNYNGGRGNFGGPLTLDLKGGSLLVMRGNCVDLAKHAVPRFPNRRIHLTFFRHRITPPILQGTVPNGNVASTQHRQGTGVFFPCNASDAKPIGQFPQRALGEAESSTDDGLARPPTKSSQTQTNLDSPGS